MKNFDNEFEKAIRFITDAMPPAEQLIKPTLFHSLRVGVYLYLHNYSREVCIAGLLHDSIEDTKITQKDIENKFGENIADIVAANTKDESLQGDEKYVKLIQQCIEYGEDAYIVKAADVLDNHIYYSRIHNKGGLEYTRHMTSLLLNTKPEVYKDVIFTELENSVNQ